VNTRTRIAEDTRHVPRRDYRSSAELVAELEMLQRSLRAHRGKTIADGALRRLLRRAAAFGFHLATLDVREHAQKHHATLAALYRRLPDAPDYARMSPEERFALLTAELRNRRPIATAATDLRGDPGRTLETMRVVRAALDRAKRAVDAAADAFRAMQNIADEAIVAFYDHAARQLEDDAVWDEIAAVNAEDVARARGRGRSTTRLAVSADMRSKMIDGLRGWATTPSRRGAVLQTIEHDGFSVDMLGAPLGIVAFVFEGRPNVLADACGVLRGGNVVAFRIGGDALATARAIMRGAIEPALAATGLPPGAVVLVDSAAHAAGWALFLDRRLSLAVARGSGRTVATLGALAQSVGTPVSLHGTGGAWIVASEHAEDDALRFAVTRSLDRKVCNTLNVCCLVDGPGLRRRADTVLDGLRQAAAARDAPFKLHVAPNAEHLLPEALFSAKVDIARADGVGKEPQAERLATQQLGIEWEWEDSPEITLAVADSIDHAVALFNEHSPRLVATLVSRDSSEQERFYQTIDAPFVGDGHSRWVDGQFALGKPELGLSNWENGRLFGRAGVLTGDSVYTIRTRYRGG
jgi:glutamate-5-semialdehyde dehydrogenase